MFCHIFLSTHDTFYLNFVVFENFDHLLLNVFMINLLSTFYLYTVKVHHISVKAQNRNSRIIHKQAVPSSAQAGIGLFLYCL